jgi:quercetin dioxygenase-like cupin family protein
VPKVGDVVENPVNRDRLTIVTNDDELYAMDYTMFPGGFISTLHTHPNQEERFKVISGRPRFTVARKVHDASPGEELAVPPGTPHLFHNPTDEDVHMLVEFRPALRTAELFATLGAIAVAGGLNKRGIPRNLLLGALFAYEFRNEVRAAGLMRPVNAIAVPFARVARRLGIRLPQ